MWRSVIFTLSMAMAMAMAPAGFAKADDASRTLALWATQGGPWVGFIDIYAADSPEPTRVSLSTRWDAVPDGSIVTKIETFSSDAGDNSAVTILYADDATGHVVTPYYFRGGSRDYRFALTSLAVTDDQHWTTIIATPGDRETYEGRPARLRYVRTRRADTIENTKEVFFLDVPEATWELRSFIRQSLVAEP